MTERINITCYLTVEPTFDVRGNLRSVSAARVTKNKPRGGTSSVGAAIIKLNLEMPRRVFIPYSVEADVTAGEGDVGVVKVVVEPFVGEDTTGGEG